MSLRRSSILAFVALVVSSPASLPARAQARFRDGWRKEGKEGVAKPSLNACVERLSKAALIA